MMFRIVLFLLTLMISGCVTWHKSNISTSNALKIETGMTVEQVEKILKKKPYNKVGKYNSNVMLSYSNFYTLDYQKNGIFYCKSFVVEFSAYTNKVSKTSGVVDSSAQDRCNNYALQQQNNNAALLIFANTLNSYNESQINSYSNYSESHQTNFTSNNYNQESYNNFSSKNRSFSSLSCGIKPIPQIGCVIGDCIDGSWQQICNNSLQCGIKPIPQIGCIIGDCVNGRWEQVCNNSLQCGIKPIPKIGCIIGDCVNGRWEQICN